MRASPLAKCSIAALLVAFACEEKPVSDENAGAADAHGFTAPARGTAAANAKFAEGLALEDRGDFDEARRGLVESDPALELKTATGRVFRSADYDFVRGDAPASVNPSLWRQAQLNDLHGLFQVADGIYQV